MENGFEASIFTPSDNINWWPTSSKLLYGGYALVLASLFLNYLFDSTPNFSGFAVFCLIIALIGAVWGWTEKERPNGKIYGTLKVYEEGIFINEQLFEWDQISNFSFNLMHIKGEYLHTIGYRFYGGPAYSAGVDSYIEFTHDMEQYKVFFEVGTSSHYVDISNAFRFLFYIGKIRLQTTYNGLHLSYEEIQNLKQNKLEFKNKSS